MRRFPGLTQTVRNWAHGAKEWAADTWTGVTHTAEDISHQVGDTLEGMAHSFEDSVDDLTHNIEGSSQSASAPAKKSVYAGGGSAKATAGPAFGLKTSIERVEEDNPLSPP